MKTRLFFAPVICLTLFISAHLYAADTKYLTPTTVPDGTTLLPAPPQAGSAEEREDAEMAFRVYSTRKPEQVALGKAENKFTVFGFAPIAGPWFQPAKCPKTEALFNQVESETRWATAIVKSHFKRLRPCNAEPERFSDPIEPAKTNNNGTSFYSYPSGTTTRGTVYAFLLIELFPEKRDALLAKAREIGWLRIQGGVHYPLDVFAGRVWGQALAHAFLANPQFEHDFAEAKAELAAAQK
jgi:acid phosphatase (class A)